MGQQQLREDKKGTSRQNSDSYRQGFNKQDMTLKVEKPNKEAEDNARGETDITTEIQIYYEQPGSIPLWDLRIPAFAKYFVFVSFTTEMKNSGTY